MKAIALFTAAVVRIFSGLFLGFRLGSTTLRGRGIFLSEKSPVRSEICAALAGQVFTISDKIRDARDSGRPQQELNRILPSQNWSYEPREDGFIVRWKLSYDDDLRYESWSDSVVGSNDFESTTKRKN